MIRSVSFVTHYRTRFKIAIFRETFEEIYDMCSFQDSRSSTMRPKYLNLFTRLISEPSTRTAIKSVVLCTFRFVPIIINSVLSAFKLSLLLFSQSHIFTMSGINLYSTSETLSIVADALVSSAYIVISAFSTQFGKSFINIMKSNGPKIDPCGTPGSTFLKLDRCTIVYTGTLLSICQIWIKKA